MRKIFGLFLSLVCAVSVLSAQFQQTGGPVGGTFKNIGISDNSLFVVSQSNVLFESIDGQWHSRGQLGYAYGFYTSDNAIFYSDYQNIYKSTDHGDSWEILFTGNNVNFVEENESGFYISVDDSLMVSTDNGTSWAPGVGSQYANTILFGEPTIQRLNEVTAVCKTDETIILGCTTSVYPIPQGAYVTSDNGENWVFAQGLEEPTYVRNIINYDGKVFLAGSSGIYVSEDGGFNWNLFSEGLMGEFGALQADKFIKFGDQLFVKVYADINIYKLNGTTWEPAGDFPDFFSSYITDNEIYLAAYNKILSYNPVTNGTTDLTNGIIASYTVISPKNDNEAYALSNSKLNKTVNSGEDWVEIETPFTIGTLTPAGDDLYATSGSGIFKSSDGGTSWNSANGGLSTNYNQHCARILASDGILYAGFSKVRPRTHLSAVWEAGGVYKSTNGGNSWQSISGNLPSEGGIKMPIYNMVLGDNQIIIRGISGIFRTTNGGSSWVNFTDGLADNTYIVRYIDYNNKIFATSNTGIYYSSSENNAWVAVSEGLTVSSMYFSGSIPFVYQGNLYLYNYALEQLFSFTGSEWVEENYSFPSNVQFRQFETSGLIVWGASIDRGVWTGSPESSTATNSLSYNDGWNLVSIPTSQGGKAFSELFQNIEGTGFGFDNGYIQQTAPSLGEGYWLKFSSPEQVQLSGTISEFQIDVAEGWNLIGPLHFNLPVGSIHQSSGNLIESSYFGFDNGYTAESTLEPGKGYWVKASSAGTLTYDPTLANASLEELVNAELIDFSLSIGENYNTNFVLGFAENASNSVDHKLGESELPPAPPVGISDARLVNLDGLFVNSDVRANNEAPVHNFNLLVSNNDHPVIFKFSSSAFSSLTLAYNTTEIIVNVDEEVILPSNITDGKISLLVNNEGTTSVAGDYIPEDYMLYSNYPNPFNPSTTVKFELPESSIVELVVFDILGNEVATLVDENMSAGVFTKTFNASTLSSGVYLLKINAQGESGKTYQKISKMILMK